MFHWVFKLQCSIGENECRISKLYSSLHLQCFSELAVVMCEQTKKQKKQQTIIQTSLLFLACLRGLSTNREEILEVSALGAYLRQMIQKSVIVPSQVILHMYLYQEKENRLKQRSGLASPTQGTTMSSYMQGKCLLIQCPDNWEIVKPRLQGALHASQN